MHRTRSRRPSSAVVPAAILSAVWLGTLSTAAVADTYSWAGATGNFSTGASWSGGVAPTGLSATDTLVFNTPNPYTATNNIYTAATRRQFYLSTMTLNDPSAIVIASLGRTGTGTVTPGITPIYPPFRFVTGNGLIDQQGAGTANVSAPIVIGPGGSLTIQAAAGSGQLTMGNLTSGATLANNFQFTGEGVLNFNNLSSNPILVGNMAQYIGAVNVLAGTVVAADSPNTATLAGAGTGGGDTISNVSLITVAAGATFDFNRNGETMSAVAGAGTIALGNTGGIGMNYASDVTFSGTLAQAGGGTPGGVTKDLGSGRTTYTWTGDAQHAGATVSNAGNWVFSGNGKLSSTLTLTTANGGAMTFDNTATNLSGRINPAATLNVGGPMTIIGAPGAATNEVVAQLNIGVSVGGEGTLNVVNGSGGGTASLTAGQLVVGTGSGGYINFTGSGSVFITNAPALTNGVIPQSTVNYADWTTIDAGNGNKIVPLSTYQTSSNPATWAAGENVKVTGALSGNADAGTSTVNTLSLGAGATVNVGSSLSLSAGGLLATGSSTVDGGQISSSGANNQLTTVVAPGAMLTVNSDIVDGPGAGTVLKFGPGTLVLGGNNTFSGSLVMAKGVVEVASAAAMGNGTLSMVGGTLRFTGPVSTTKNVSLFGVESVIDTGANNVTMTGSMGATGGGNLTKRGAGSLTLNLFNSSGDLLIEEGSVITASTGNTFTNGTKITVAAGALLDLSYDSGGEDLGMIEGAGTIYTGAGLGLSAGGYDNITFSGSIKNASNGVVGLHTGGVDKSGVGSLTLSGTSSYGGNTRVQQGTLVVAADALPGVDGPLGNSTASLTLGFGVGTGSAESEMVAPVQLLTGLPGVTIGRGLAVAAGTNAASGTATGMVTIGSKHTTGSSTFSGTITLGRATEVYAAGTSTVSLTGVVSGGGALSKIGGGTAVLTGTNTFTGGVHVQSGNLVLASPAAGSTGSYNVSGGTLTAQAGLASPLKGTGLFLSNQGTFDLNDNDLVVDYPTTSPLAAVKAAVVAARNGGAWNQPGLTSTFAKNSNNLTTLAVVEASDLGVTDFGGVTVDGTAVLVKYTYYGDVNVDGRLDGDDYALADRSLAMGGLPGTATWIKGDVNYDDVVNAGDFFLIDRSFAMWGGMPLSPEFLAGRAAQFGDGYVSALVAAVPEPTSLGLVGIAASGLLARRRRQR